MNTNEISDFNESLIKEVRNYENLWNPHSPLYRDYAKTEQTWRIVGAKLNENAEDCKKKFKNLRDVYVKNKRDELEAMKDGQIFQSKWKYYSALQFLDVFVKHRRSDLAVLTRKTAVLKTNSNEQQQSRPDIAFCESEETCCSTISEMATSEPTVTNNNVKRRRSRRFCKSYLDHIDKVQSRCATFRPQLPRPTTFVATFKKDLQTDDDEDGDALLGRLVVSTFRRLHPSLKPKGKLSVQQVLCDLEERSIALYLQETKKTKPD